MRLPFRRREKEASEARAVIATVAVKDEAMALAGDLRKTLRKLDQVLRDEAAVGDTGEHESRDG